MEKIINTADNVHSGTENRVSLHRLTALWALSESALGGILHGFKIPFAGMIVSAIAVMSIAFMIRIGARRGDLLKSLLIVATVKAIVSPHSPPTAYLAFFMQGGMALLFYPLLRKHLWAVYGLIFFAVVESALQKIIVLTLIFGQDLWTSIDVFANYLHGLILPGNPPVHWHAGYLVMAFYILIHFLFAIMAALWIRNFFRDMDREEQNAVYILEPDTREIKARKRKIRLTYLIYPLAVILMALTFVVPVFDSGVGFRALRMIIRSTVILGIWYVWLGPIVTRKLHRALRNRQSRYHDDLENILLQLPLLRRVLLQEWHRFKQQDKKNYRSFVEKALYILLFSRIEQAPEKGK